MKKNKDVKYLILLLSVAVIWGFGFLSTTWALQEGFTVVMFNILRFGASAVVLGVVFFKQISKLTLKQVGYGALTAVLLVAGFWFQTAALGSADASTANISLFTASGVVMVPFFCWIIKRKKPSLNVFIAAILAFLSALCINLNGEFGHFSKGDLLALASAACFGLHYVVLDFTSKKVEKGALTFLQMAFATVGFAIVGLIFSPSDFTLSGVSAAGWGWMAEIVVLGTVFAYIVQTFAQNSVSPAYASVMLSAEGIFGSIFSLAFGMISFSWWIVAGTVFMAAAVVLTEGVRLKKPKEISSDTDTKQEN